MTDPPTDWIVLRYGEDMPVEYRAPDLDGLWIPRDQAPRAQSVDAARQAAQSHENEHLVMDAVGVPTDRGEWRTVHGDGVVCPSPLPKHAGRHIAQRAQVYEIRPLRKVDESW